MAKNFDFTAPCKVTITNIINPADPALINRQAQTGKRRVMKLSEAIAAGFKDFEYMLDKDGNFVVDPVSGATANPADPIQKDNILVIVRESVKYTDRFIQFFATQQKIKLDAGDSITFTSNCPAALAHYQAQAVEGEIEVVIVGAATKTASNAADVTAALNDPAITNLDLTADIAMPNTVKVVNNGMEINGNGKTITATVATSGDKEAKDGLLALVTDNTVIKDVTIDVAGIDPTAWNGNYGIQIYTGSATVQNVTAKNANTGILVNGAKATLVDTVDVSNNGFGGIEVSQGTNATTAPMLDASRATLVNTTEAYGKPTIYIDGFSKLGLECVKAPAGMTGVEFKGEDGKKDQYHFYLNAKNAVSPEVTPESK